MDEFTFSLPALPPAAGQTVASSCFADCPMRCALGATDEGVTLIKNPRALTYSSYIAMLFLGIANSLVGAAARQLALVGLRARYPEATEAQLRRWPAELLLGPELALRAYSPHP